MKGFFSFRVIAPDVVVLPEHFLALDEGVQVFNLMVNDLDTFLGQLRACGVKVLNTYHLDEHEEIPPVCIDVVLPSGDRGDDPGLLQAKGETSDHRGSVFPSWLVGPARLG